MKKLLIFDGNSIMNRAFYGVRPLSNKEGLQTNAIYGFVTIVKKHMDRLKPDYAAVAFDVREPTFRHKYYDGYKATRSPMKEELSVQVPYIHRVSELLGLNVIMTPGFEADDILGTAAANANRGGVQAFIVTGDRDSFQLVSDMTTVILAATAGDESITPEVIREKYSLSPEQLIDVKAIAGDTSDNIPGVRGIGEKGAVKLIGETGSLDALYDGLNDMKLSDSLRRKLTEGKDSAFMSRYLAKIKTDVPGVPALDRLEVREPDIGALRELFTKLEFFKMLKDLDGHSRETAPEQPAEEQLQISIDSVQSEGDPLDGLEDNCPVTDADADSIADGGDLCFAFDKDDNVYILKNGEVMHITGDIAKLMRRIRPTVFSYKDYCHLYHRLTGDDSADGLNAAFDISIGAYLVNPGDNATGLERIAFIYLKRSIGTQRAADPKFSLGLFPELRRILSEELEQLGMHRLYYDIELPLARVLAKAEMRGFRILTAELAQYGDTLRARMKELESEIYAQAGESFNLNSPKQLSDVLFSENKLNLPHSKKTKSGYSTDAETLEKLKGFSPVVSMILDYRALSKLIGTYVDGLARQVDAHGRIHTQFLQTQTQTGRLSSVEPNLQNIPVRTPQGRELRRFFVADEGKMLIDADYSQIELRLLAHISGDRAFTQAFNSGRDIHTQTASEIFHVAPEHVTPEMRKNAKAVNFGIVYGIGDYSLSVDIGTSRAQAAAYIERYFESYPTVRDYLERVKVEAKRDGYVTTLFGRRRYIPELSATKKPTVAFGERVAMNTPIQGTAADIIKLAMVNTDRRLEKEIPQARLIMQVHDELIIECPENKAEEAARLLKQEMESAVSLTVELRADVGVGKSWYETH